MSKQIRWTTTKLILEMNEFAVKNGLNRSLNDNWGKNIDPDGIHILRMSFQHHHRAGLPYKTHWRTFWLCKMFGSDDPCEVVLDVKEEMYENFIFSSELKEGLQGENQ